ncbi:MAG: carboxypeptidase-like regulatory domain-containing protein [Candidatus Thermoplasmatota archaeon]
MRFALLIALVLTGCLAPYGGGDVGSGIFGVAMMGPTCPVERNPPDPACADRPYEGKLTATSADGGAAGTFSTDAQGRFNVSLPAGEYSIRTTEPNRLPSCSNTEPILVAAGLWTRVNVSCDTGTR